MRPNRLRLLAILAALPFLAGVYAGCSKEEAVVQPVVKKAIPKKAAETAAHPVAVDNAVPAKSAQAALYNPAEKRDPFAPFLRPPAKVPTVAVPVGPPTLMSQDLSSFKYVGMVWSPRAVRGLIEDVEGKGYTVTTGSRLGRSGAVVTRITEKEIVVKEETKDYTGATVVRETSLKLKSAGGK